MEDALGVEPITISGVAAGAVGKAIDGLGASLAKQIGKFTKPVIDRAVVDLGIGFRSYLDASYNRCRYFKTILNQSQPLEVIPYYVNNTLTCGSRKVSDDTLIKNLDKLKYVVVSGLAGSGKSMFMKYLTISKFENTSGGIPLFIELRQINSLTQKDLLEFVKAQCIASGHNVSMDQFKLALSAGAFCLILDGFDELNHEFRDDMSSQIMDISRKYPSVSIIISSRHDDRFGSWASFHVYGVDSLSKKQTLKLIDTLEYDSGVKRRFHREVKDRLYDSHTSFLSSPLLTTIMLLTYEEFAEIPVKMHAFYSQAFDTLFQRHDASKEQYQRKTQTGLGKDNFKATFSAFCAMSYLNQRFSFEEDDLAETADSAVKYVKQAKTDIPKSLNATQLIADLKESVCLLQQDGLETAFVHRSFQEYFAALFATSLHGEKLRKVLDKYSLRFGDSVIRMAVDMARENVEQEWVIPTTKHLEDVIFPSSNISSTTDKMNLIFKNLSVHKSGSKVYPSFNRINMEVLGPIESIYSIYPDQIGSTHIIEALRVGMRDTVPDLINDENRGKPNFDVFEKIITSSSQSQRITNLDMDADNDWWLDAVGLDGVFNKMKVGFGVIRKDIESRTRKQKNILEDFL